MGCRIKMYKVKDKSEGVWIDALRLDGYTIRLLSMVGPTVAVRAIWARIVDSKHTYWLQLNDCELAAFNGGIGVEMKSGSYQTFREPIDADNVHLVVMDQSLRHDASILSDHLLSFQNDLFHTVDLLSPVPMRQEWSDWIVAKGIEDKRILPLHGFGRQVYRVDRDGWDEIIRDGLLSGEIK